MQCLHGQPSPSNGYNYLTINYFQGVSLLAFASKTLQSIAWSGPFWGSLETGSSHEGGEPTFRFNDLEAQLALIVQILYLGVVWALRNLLNIQDRSDEHGFETM